MSSLVLIARHGCRSMHRQATLSRVLGAASVRSVSSAMLSRVETEAAAARVRFLAAPLTINALSVHRILAGARHHYATVSAMSTIQQSKMLLSLPWNHKWPTSRGSGVHPTFTARFSSLSSSSPLLLSAASAATTTTPTASASEPAASNGSDSSSQRKTPRSVGFWLLGISAMVFATVVMGGVTRLTESGLSMVTWHPVHERPPSTEADWAAEFELYKQFPEYKVINKDMTLEEFKRIWFMEYTHRMFGRAVGAAFVLPALYFAARGYLTKPLQKRVLLIGSLIGFQGLLGWYMVKSGLDENLLHDKAVPRVSQYRLAAHLGSAFLIYALALWQGLSLIDRNLPLNTGDKRFKTLRKLATGTMHLVFLTAISGAFVAGLDAGLVYNSFPKMADKWIPDDLLVLKPTIKNFFENVTTVQFDHRILGTSTLAAISGVWLYARTMNLPTRAKVAVNALAAMATLQVTLGISTLLLLVPTPLAASHQAGSLTLLTIAIYFLHTLRKAAIIIVK